MVSWQKTVDFLVVTSDPLFNVCINTARNKAKHTTLLVNLVQEHEKFKITFDVLLTVHLSIFILVINQLDAQDFVLR